MEHAINRLTEAAGFGIAEVTTEATYRLGALYDRFGHDLEHSEAPPSLNGDALNQYKLLLQTQAEPFYDKAIKTHEANLQRVGQGLYDPWIARSVTALVLRTASAPSSTARSRAGVVVIVYAASHDSAAVV